MWRSYDGVEYHFTKLTLVVTYLLAALLMCCLRFGQIAWLPRVLIRPTIYGILAIGFVVTVFGDWDQRTIFRSPLLYVGAALLVFGLYLAK